MDGKKHLVFFSIDEMSALAIVANILVDENGSYRESLPKLPVSEEFVADLKSAAEALDKKIKEVGE